MSDREKTELIKLLESYKEMQNEQHEQFKETLAEINKKLDPVYDVYSTFKGFGTIAGGFFKWVIVPLSIVLGIIISVRNIWFK